MKESESGHPHPQFGQFHRPEFLRVENVDVVRPCFLPVWGALGEGIVVPRGYEDADAGRLLELLLEEFAGIGRDPVRLEQVPGDEDEPGFAPARVLEDPAEGGADRLPFPVTEP